MQVPMFKKENKQHRRFSEHSPGGQTGVEGQQRGQRRPKDHQG